MRLRAALGDAGALKRPGAFEPLVLADTPIVHRCLIYEKFYYPKWYTFRLTKKKHIFHITMVQY